MIQDVFTNSVNFVLEYMDHKPGWEKKMDFKKALERNLDFRTEYGGGVNLAGGLFKRRTMKRQRNKLDGTKKEDKIYEREIEVGPVAVVLRSKNPNIFSGDDYLISASLFKIFVVSNEKEFLLALKGGPSVRLLRKLLAATPAGIAAEAADIDLTARAGVRLNLTRLLNDLKLEDEEDLECELEEEEFDLG